MINNSPTDAQLQARTDEHYAQNLARLQGADRLRYGQLYRKFQEATKEWVELEKVQPGGPLEAARTKAKKELNDFEEAHRLSIS